MANQGTKNRQSIPDAPGTPRKIRDEDPPPEPCQAPGESSIGRLAFADPPDEIGETGSGSVQNRAGGLRCHVPRSEAGASGREYHVDLAFVGPPEEDRYDGFGLIRHDGPTYEDVALSQTPILHDRSALVHPFPPAPRVGHRQGPDPEGPGGFSAHRLTDPSV